MYLETGILFTILKNIIIMVMNHMTEVNISLKKLHKKYDFEIIVDRGSRWFLYYASNISIDSYVNYSAKGGNPYS
ncbi:MAG: hypothetical protein ACI8ZF_000371 [Candidatus Midichloriaceae bacterium]|jgi:hypothetical protein